MTEPSIQDIRHAKRGQAFDWLLASFPSAFNNARMPLKRGIHKEVLAVTNADRPSRRSISQAIAHYVHGKDYLRHLQAGQSRYDLEGQPCGAVTEQEAFIAKEQLARYEKAAQLSRKKKATRQTNRCESAQIIAELLESGLACITPPLVHDEVLSLANRPLLKRKPKVKTGNAVSNPNKD